MNRLSKFLAFAISAVALTGAFASEAYYGLPQHKLKTSAGFSQTVVVRNFTYYTYTASATFYPTMLQVNNLPIGPYRSGTDVVTYDINYPDTSVCVKLIRNIDHSLIYDGCVSSGDLNIISALAASKGSTAVQVVRQ